ncbi:MAG: YHS domain-containing protein [Dehalococcoidia bacterium]|nr:YHS domain-containing protein [Dehalococcoidia bacterium]
MSWLDNVFGKKEAGEKAMPAANPGAGSKQAKDPVCGMMVDEAKAAATSTYHGQIYYFCAVGCKKAFDAEPAKYLRGGGQTGAAAHGH